MEELKANRPKSIELKSDPVVYNNKIDFQRVLKYITADKFILVNDYYSSGLELLSELKEYLQKKHPDQSFIGQRDYRAEYQKLSNKILLQVSNHKLEVKKSPIIGWLEILYPELIKFKLTFPQVQGLNSSWQWYKKGLVIPVLRNKLYPYYGTYFPSRFEHLQLFDNWLKRYEGPKKTAIDVGIGSGVLSFQMVKYGFQKVFGTDNNPNAIIGLKEFMGETKLSRKIEVDYGHLFAKWDKKTELIVFNPPWLTSTKKLEGLEESMYYNENLFPEFFAQAKERLNPDGQIVLLFSNLGQITGVNKVNPIETEIEEGGRFKLDLLLKKSVKAASSKTTRNQNWRSAEVVELWVLSHK